MVTWFFAIGAISIIISGIAIGSWTNGEQHRANYHSETPEHRNKRTKIGIITGIIGVFFLGLAGLIHWL